MARVIPQGSTGMYETGNSVSDILDSFSQEPISRLEDDLLWADGPVHQQITDIANTVVQPLRSAITPKVVRFIIDGDWGAGKTSALRMIREKAGELAEQASRRKCIKFCE